MSIAGLLLCVLYAFLWAAVVLLIVEGIAWGISAVFSITVDARLIQLGRVIAFLVFLIYLVGCLVGVDFPHPFPARR